MIYILGNRKCSNTRLSIKLLHARRLAHGKEKKKYCYLHKHITLSSNNEYKILTVLTKE